MLVIMPKKKNRTRKANKRKSPSEFDNLKRRLWGQRKLNPSQAIKIPNNSVGIHRSFRIFQTYANKGDLLSACKAFDSGSNPYHKYIFGEKLADSYADLHSGPYLAYVKDYERVLRLLSLGVNHDPEFLSSFAGKAKDFIRALLKADYAASTEKLKDIVETFGVSVWVLEKSFLLAELSVGLEGNKKLLDAVLAGSGTDPIIRLICENLSLRVESKISIENFNAKLERSLDLGRKLKSLGSYIKYRLGQTPFDLVENAGLLAFYDFANPLVDRYELLIDLMQNGALGTSESVSAVERIIRDLDSTLVDERLDVLRSAIDPNYLCDCSGYDHQVHQIFDMYTRGAYPEAINSSRELLIKFPDRIELYYVYIRSCVFGDEDVVDVFKPDSLASRILDRVSLFLTGKGEMGEIVSELEKIAMTLGREPISRSLRGLISREYDGVVDPQVIGLDLLNGSSRNPRFLNVYRNAEYGELYLDKMRSEFGDSSVLTLVEHCADSTCTGKTMPDLAFVPEERRVVYQAEFAERSSAHQEAISLVEPLYLDRLGLFDEFSFYIKSRVVSCLFRCYLTGGDLLKCTDLVVRSYVKDPSYVRNLDLDSLVSSLDQGVEPELMSHLSYPILYSIVGLRSRVRFVAYDNFMRTVGLRRPMQLSEFREDYDHRELVLFLSEVCIMDVYVSSFYFSGTEDVENERIRICQLLTELDPKNGKRYSNEISDITSKFLIRKGMRQADESKIYVDETGIRGRGRRVLHEDYDRYRALARLSNIENLKIINTGEFELIEVGADGGMTRRKVGIGNLSGISGTRIVGKSLYLIFRELFEEVRNRFISSGEHGLDGYLGVRIRHGVLLNQVRSPFDALNLLAEKDTTTGEYLPIDHWNRELSSLLDVQRHYIQSALFDFTRNVDTVAQRLNADLIRIRDDEESPSGLFDYQFGDGELFDMFSNDIEQLEGYDQFLDSLFRRLWRRTEENLKCIRDLINVEVTEEMQGFIDSLDSKLRSKIDPVKAAGLLRCVARSSTECQRMLATVSSWFTVSRSKLIEKFTLLELVTICVESINNVYPNRKVEPDLSKIGDFDFGGRYFAAFFDIVRTILDNVIMHSGLSSDMVELRIESEVEGSVMIVRFRNRISDDVRRSDPVSMLETRFGTVVILEALQMVAVEGSSGLYKVLKLGRVDLSRERFDMQFMYDEEGNFVVSLVFNVDDLDR